MNLKDKVVIITGASQGIGAAIARIFAAEGANLVLTCRHNPEGAEAIKQEVEKQAPKVMLFQGDLADEATVSQLFKQTTDTFGRVDILINNAGKSEPKELLETTKSDWLLSFNDNFFSTVLCTKEALKIMKAQKSGKIINMSSINGIENVGRPGNIAYSTAKGAIVNFTKALAIGYAPDIQINAVAPGKTMTEIWTLRDAETLKTATNDVPLQRFVEPREVAETFLFLAKNDAIIGEVIVVDGGFNIKAYL